VSHRRAQLDTESIEDALNGLGRRWGVTVLKIDRRPKHFEAVLKSKASDHLARVILTPGRREGDVKVVFQEEVPEQYLSWMRSPHRYVVTTALGELPSLFNSLMQPVEKDWSRDVKEGSVNIQAAARRVASKWLRTAGGDEFVMFGRGTNAKKIFNDLVEDARFEYGSGGYSGSIAEKDGFKIRSHTPMTRAQANAFIDRDIDQNDKWGPAFAVPIASKTGKVEGYMFYGWASS
jgi:hypothetical protein